MGIGDWRVWKLYSKKAIMWITKTTLLGLAIFIAGFIAYDLSANAFLHNRQHLSK